VAERVREAVAQHKFSLGDAKGSWAKVTVSSGCSQLDPDAGDHARNLIRIADQYLYEAKRAGRDQVAYPPLDETEARVRLAGN
jgi:diguanylate cyclase (GGDEF)-like protein